MDINELTVGQINELKSMFGSSCSPPSTGPVAVGDKVFIRTVTYHLIGKVVQVRKNWVQLSLPSWVASSGRWHTALHEGVLDEVEMCMDHCWVNLDTATDIHPWVHDLPTESK